MEEIILTSKEFKASIEVLGVRPLRVGFVRSPIVRLFESRELFERRKL